MLIFNNDIILMAYIINKVKKGLPGIIDTMTYWPNLYAMVRLIYDWFHHTLIKIPSNNTNF